MNADTSSAFWLFNNTPEQWTEIDVAELAGSLPRQMPTNVHDIRENGQPVVPGGSLQNPQIVKFDDANVPAGQTQDNSFHTYGLDWNADTINWYLDGKLVRSIVNDHWHQPQQVNLTNQVPSWAARRPPTTWRLPIPSWWITSASIKKPRPAIRRSARRSKCVQEVLVHHFW